MIEIITAAAFALAWFVFRYARHQRWRDAVDSAERTLRAVHHGMVQGLTPGQPSGWGQLYFSTVYTEKVAKERAQRTFDLVSNRMLDLVLVVPTEPLARLATTPPHKGLIETETVAIANFALWRVQAFNQLVQHLGDFLTRHASEIVSLDTGDDRRHELAQAASSLSLFVHLDGIGDAWANFPDGSQGWYRALVTQVLRNMNQLADVQAKARWRWLREWQYVIVDVLALTGVIAVTATVALEAR